MAAGDSAMHITRRGVTLTEVLVAIFCCGLGLMALMTLFPLGAINMAQALKDDRSGHAAGNASSIFRTLWRVNLESGAPNPIEADLMQGPVYVDPLGFIWFGNQPLPGGIPRRSFNNMTFQQAMRWCTLLDDIRFQPNATPESYALEPARDGRLP